MAQHQQLKSAPSLERDGRRMVALFEPKVGGPLAAMWLSHAILPGGRRQPESVSSQQAGSASASSSKGVRFTLTRTEDAMDSVLPCAAEELLRPLAQRASKFGNPAKMRFHMA